MRRQLAAALVMLAVFTVLTGFAYPLLVTGIGQAAFHDKADGSLVKIDGVTVGSKWIAQNFTKPEYFHPRPSAANYDGAASSGSNKGPTNPAFLKDVAARVHAYRHENGLAASAEVPVDAVTASASGLDPDISIANARLQARRVADARDMTLNAVLRVIDHATQGRGLGFLGEKSVNVLELNLALDRASR